MLTESIKVISFIQGRFATANGSEIRLESCVKDLQLSKDEIQNSENMNREAGETQQTSNGNYCKRYA
jgi:hypothetical protein